MEEITIDQEDVVVVAVNDEVEEEFAGIDYSEFSEEDFTVKDESEIDWSNL